jgi:DNA polymerase delta subunit 1
VYGFTGASKGILPCVAIAETVTSVGRDMIHQTKEVVERMPVPAEVTGAVATHFRVIYGDTDSVMIDFGIPSDHPDALALAFKIAPRVADIITDLFPNHVTIEFEKAYWPYLLLAKKRYVGLMFTNQEKHDKIDAKGIEIVRRDFSNFARNVLQAVVDPLMYNRSIKEAKAALAMHMRSVRDNKVWRKI